MKSVSNGRLGYGSGRRKLLVLLSLEEGSSSSVGGNRGSIFLAPAAPELDQEKLGQQDRSEARTRPTEDRTAFSTLATGPPFGLGQLQLHQTKLQVLQAYRLACQDRLGGHGKTLHGTVFCHQTKYDKNHKYITKYTRFEFYLKVSKSILQSETVILLI